MNINNVTEVTQQIQEEKMNLYLYFVPNIQVQLTHVKVKISHHLDNGMYSIVGKIILSYINN